MKKLCFILSIVLCLGVLTSCRGGGPTADRELTSGQASAGGRESVSGGNSPSGQTLAMDENVSDPMEYDLHMVTPSGGLSNGSLGISDDGCYEIYSNGDWTANILYTDVATKQRIYLSPDLSSDHHSEADPSWIDDTMGGVDLFVAQDHLFIQKSGYDETAGALYRSDLNGENRTKLLEFRDYAPIRSTVVSDGQYLYVLLTKSSGRAVLARLSTDNGDIEELCEMPFDTNFLLSAYEDCLVIKALDVPEPKDGENAVDTYENTRHVVYQYSLAEHQLTEVISWKQDTMFEGYDGSGLYLFDRANDCLKAVDLHDGTETMVISSLKEKGINKDEVSYISCVQDGHMIYDEGGWSYVLDLSTLEISEMKYLENYKYPYIISSYGDKYLIAADDLIIPMDDFDPGGNPIIVDVIMSQLALITQEDYWSCNYNFERIKNTFLDE